MPELPEVRNFLAEWRAVVEGEKLLRVDVLDSIVVTNPAEELENAFLQKSFTQFVRVGKQMFTGTADGRWLRFHFGMTGHFHYAGTEPRFSRIAFHFSNGKEMDFCDARKFGRVEIIESPEKFLRENIVGPDALEISWEEFQAILGGKKGKIKPILMDQSLLAGIGNIYADEMLFQAGIHPEALLAGLSAKRLKKLFEAMRRSMAQSITYDTPVGEIPDGFFIVQRKKDGICPICGAAIQESKIGGRGTYYCGKCQRK